MFLNTNGVKIGRLRRKSQPSVAVTFEAETDGQKSLFFVVVAFFVCERTNV